MKDTDLDVVKRFFALQSVDIEASIKTLRYHELKTYRDMVEKNQRYASKIRELSVELITDKKLLKDLNTYSHECNVAWRPKGAWNRRGPRMLGGPRGSGAKQVQ